MRRRRFLATTGTVALASLAGCSKPSPDRLELPDNGLTTARDETILWVDIHNPTDTTYRGRTNAILYNDDGTRLTTTSTANTHDHVVRYDVETGETARFTYHWDHTPTLDTAATADVRIVNSGVFRPASSTTHTIDINHE